MVIEVIINFNRHHGFVDADADAKQQC